MRQYYSDVTELYDANHVDYVIHKHEKFWQGQISVRKAIPVLEIHVELHTPIAYLSLHSSLKRIMNTPPNVYSIHNSQCLRVYLVIMYANSFTLLTQVGHVR